MILVDTDPAAGLPLCDVDDVIALHFLHAAGVPFEITTCYGNTDGVRTRRVAHELGERWGVTVHDGATHRDDVDTPAVEALAAHRGTVLALAPLTNIRAALDRGARWERLVVLGGTARRRPNVRYVHTTELNFALDEPAAARALMATTTLFPMEPCRKVLFGEAERRRLPGWLAERVRGWLRIAPLSTGRRAFHPWDLLPAVWLHAPHVFRSERRSVRLVSAPLRRGQIRYGPGDVEVVTDVDAEAFIRTWASVV
ncbi:MAG: nucleoside hydrolase [Myxococcota bacterium]